jgi:hypothetical protein
MDRSMPKKAIFDPDIIRYLGIVPDKKILFLATSIWIQPNDKAIVKTMSIL